MPKNVKISFTIKRLDINVKIEQNIKVVLQPKTKAINKKEINTNTFSFSIGKINNVDPSLFQKLHEQKFLK